MRLQLLPQARIDILDAIAAFEDLAEGLGERFEDELFACFGRIKSDPELFAKNSLGFRASRLDKFTAVVYFQEKNESACA